MMQQALHTRPGDDIFSVLSPPPHSCRAPHVALQQIKLAAGDALCYCIAAWEGCLLADYKANLRGVVPQTIASSFLEQHSAQSLFVTAPRFMLLKACVTALAIYAPMQLPGMEWWGACLKLWETSPHDSLWTKRVVS